VFIGILKLKPKQVEDSFGKVCREIELRGEERVKKKVKVFLVLD
jgi:hypothetical protein